MVCVCLVFQNCTSGDNFSSTEVMTGLFFQKAWGYRKLIKRHESKHFSKKTKQTGSFTAGGGGFWHLCEMWMCRSLYVFLINGICVVHTYAQVFSDKLMTHDDYAQINSWKPKQAHTRTYIPLLILAAIFRCSLSHQIRSLWIQREDFQWQKHFSLALVNKNHILIWG